MTASCHHRMFSTLYPARLLCRFVWSLLLFMTLVLLPSQARAQVSVTVTPATTSAQPKQVCLNSSTNFTASASGCGTGAFQYYWAVDSSFGPGSLSPDYTYIATSSGSHTIICRAYNPNCGSYADGTAYVVVSTPTLSLGAITYNPTAPTTCSSISFSVAATQSSGCANSPVDYVWTWDGVADPNHTSSPSASHQFTTSGSHTVQVTGTITGGNSASSTVNLTVGAGSPPTMSNPTFSPGAPTTCSSVAFSSDAQSTCGGGALTYYWTFGDGFTSTAQSPTHKYNSPNNSPGYPVTLTVSNANGQVQKSVTVPVVSGDPGAVTGLAIQSADYNLVMLTWNAAANASTYKVCRNANGSPTYTQVATVSGTTFADSAVSPTTYYCYYVVPVSVCSTLGAASGTVCVTTPCHDTLSITSAAAAPNAVQVGQSVSFTGAATTICSTPSYHWDFGDGVSANTASAAHSYGSIGAYTATLTVTAGTNSASRSVTVRVYALSRPFSPGDPFGTGAGGGSAPGEDGGAFPGSPMDPHYHHCAKSCTQGSDALGYSTVCTDTYSGNTRMWRKDPIRTRGYPINCDVTINTQTVNFNRPMGNAAFSYDIFVSNMTVYDGACHGTQHWCVVDGDGTQLDFGVASAAPQPTLSVFSSLVTIGSGSNITGYQLLHAGPPGNLRSYGNFTYSFNAAGQLVQLVDPHGNPQSLTYSSGRLATISDVNTGKSASIDYNAAGLVDHVVLNGGGIVNKFNYTNGLMTGQTVTDASSNVITTASIEYNPDATFSGITQDNNTARKMKFAYVPLASNDCSAATVLMGTTGAGPTGTEGTIKYDAPKPSDAADTVYVTNAQGGVTKCDYNAQLEMFRMTLPKPIGATAAPVYTFAYNSDRECTSMSDGVSTVTMTYNATGVANNPGTGYMTSIKDNLNNTWNWSWNNADLISMQDPVEAAASVSNTAVYGNSGQPHIPTSITDSAGYIWSPKFNNNGQPTQVVPPRNSPTISPIITYDEAPGSPNKGYPLYVTDGNGNKVTFDAYDAVGDLLQASTYPITGDTTTKNTTFYTYDSAQRVTSVTLPDMHTVQYFYNGQDLDHVIDPSGAQYNYSYCASCGALTGVAGPAGWGLSWILDDDKNMTSFTDANGHKTTYTFGQAEELQKVTYPDNTTFTYSYGNTFMPQSFTNGRNHTISLGLDAIERIHTITFPTSGDPGLTFDYNADGSMHDFIDGMGTTTLTYLNNGWLQSVQYNYATAGLANVQRLDYTYYPNGLRNTMKWTNGSTIIGTWVYSYDFVGNLKKVLSPWNEATLWARDGEDKLITQTNANGTVVTYGYNQQRGWPTSITTQSGATQIASYALTYDNGNNTLGNLTGVSENAGASTVSYGYNSLNRLTSDTRTGTNAYSHTYNYDLAGNRNYFDGATQTYDAANKLTSWNDFTGYAFDADGNWTVGVGWTATFDDLNHRTHVQGPSPDPDMTYGYDARGRRVMSQPAGGAKTFYIFDGGTLLGEVKNTTGNPATAAYTWGENGLISERLLTPTAKSLWYHFGPQGETRQLTNSAGTVVDTYNYTAFGSNVATTGTDINPFQYGGRFGYYTHADAPNQGILCGRRWYSKNYGFFMTRDPLEYGGGPNMYAYCDGDPVNSADPSGCIDYETDNIDRIGNYATVSESGVNTAADVVDGIGNFCPAYSAATAATGVDIAGRCLSAEERALRGASAAMPLLSKLRIGKFCLFGCFIDGTLVQMADGTTKPIEQIKQGDLVLSKDETTGIVSPKRVTGTSTSTVPNIETVNLADATGKIVESFTATADHPFYVEGQGFTAAYQMPVGTKVVTKNGTLTVASTERHEAAGGYVVHNFTVEDDHSYFVGSANGGAWVHNGDCWEFAERVEEQLLDSRLGSLAGKFSKDDIIAMANAKNALRVIDEGSDALHVNIIQEVEGVNLRITVTSDTARRIISVGRVKTKDIIKYLAYGRWRPIN